MACLFCCAIRASRTIENRDRLEQTIERDITRLAFLPHLVGGPQAALITKENSILKVQSSTFASRKLRTASWDLCHVTWKMGLNLVIRSG